MSHVYQPVMLWTLIDKKGKDHGLGSGASVVRGGSGLSRLLPRDHEAHAWRGAAAARRLDYQNAEYSIPGFDEMTAAEPHEIIALCHAKVDAFLEKRSDPWSHRRKSAGYVSGTLRYEVLKRAMFRWEACGGSAENRALEVDHIVPSSGRFG
jgi:hypothetical protein